MKKMPQWLADRWDISKVSYLMVYITTPRLYLYMYLNVRAYSHRFALQAQNSLRQGNADMGY